MEKKDWKGALISFEKRDGKVMVNATEMAKPFGKTCKDWLRTEQSQQIIAAVCERQKCHSTDLVVVTYGNDGGTWMHEDIALVFAQWLSPSFYIWCNDQIKELMTKGVVALPGDYLSALKALVVAEEEKQRLALENSSMRPKADYFDAIVDRNLLTNFRDTAKELHIKQTDFITWLEGRGFIYRDARKQIKPIAQCVEDGWFEMKEYTKGDHAGNQTLITPKGRETFRLLLSVGKNEKAITPNGAE